jgi:hypothetical protein
MANAVDQLNGLTIAHAKLASLANGDRMTVDNAVHDGDTVKVDPDGNISTRFLGIDTPEVSFTLPDAPKTFRPISSAQWTTFLTDPFAAGQPPRLITQLRLTSKMCGSSELWVESCLVPPLSEQLWWRRRWRRHPQQARTRCLG